MASAKILSSWSPTPIDRPVQGSRLEQLPPELLIKTLRYVTFPRHETCEGYTIPRDVNTNVGKEHVSLLPSLVTSRTLSSIAIGLIYRDPKISTLEDLEAFVQNLIADSRLNKFVRRLDLSRLAPGQSPSASEGRITSLLSELFSRTPLLQELYVDQYLGNFLDQKALEIIFGNLKQLHTLQLTSCQSQQFTNAFVAASKRRWLQLTALRTLHLRKCSNLPVEVFISLFPSLPSLRCLDISDSRVDGEALQYIPSSARLQRLNLSHCTNVPGQELANFLSHHLAIKNSLISLDVSQTPDERTTDETQLSQILSDLPSTIRALNLRNCRSSSSHISLLQNQYGNLELLTIGSDMSLPDVEDIVLSSAFQFDSPTDDDDALPTPTEFKYQSVLAPMEKAVAVCKARQRIDSVAPRTDCPVSQQSRLRYLDITSLSIPEQSKIGSSVLLSRSSWPLAVIEISNTVLLWNELLSGLCKALGWRVRRAEGRCWLERRGKTC